MNGPRPAPASFRTTAWADLLISLRIETVREHGVAAAAVRIDHDEAEHAAARRKRPLPSASVVKKPLDPVKSFVQLTPSGEVSAAPKPPTVTNRLPVQTTP